MRKEVGRSEGQGHRGRPRAPSPRPFPAPPRPSLSPSLGSPYHNTVYEARFPVCTVLGILPLGSLGLLHTPLASYELGTLL